MTGAELRRTAAFVVACVAAGMAIALLAVVVFPELAGGALSRLAPPAPPAAAVQPSAPAPAAPARTASGGAAQPEPPDGRRASSLAEVLAPQPMFSYAAAVRASSPAVVNIYTVRVVTERLPSIGLEQFFGSSGQPRYRQRVQNALGSGVIVDRQGHIVTNHHVVAQADQIRVQLADGRSADAKVVGRDPDTDLAVLQIALKNLPVMQLGRSDTLQVGDSVLAIGNPLGLSQTVTHGIVSATGRAQLGVATYESFIQTDAAINVGNSGGALVNARGELVGINTAVLGKQMGAEGIGVAIPVDLVRGVMQEILAHGRVVRGWIGIVPEDVNEQVALQNNLPHAGVAIAGVAQGSPAATAGLMRGDMIVAIDDRPVRSAQDALTQIATRMPGQKLTMRVTRGEQQRVPVQISVSEPPRPLDTAARPGRP
jgi:serine protease DegS